MWIENKQIQSWWSQGGCIHGCDASFFSWKMRIQPRPENSHRGLIMHPTAITDELTTIPIPLLLSLPLYSSLTFTDSSFFFFFIVQPILPSCVFLSSFLRSLATVGKVLRDIGSLNIGCLKIDAIVAFDCGNQTMPQV